MSRAWCSRIRDAAVRVAQPAREQVDGADSEPLGDVPIERDCFLDLAFPLGGVLLHQQRARVAEQHLLQAGGLHALLQRVQVLLGCLLDIGPLAPELDAVEAPACGPLAYLLDGLALLTVVHVHDDRIRHSPLLSLLT